MICLVRPPYLTLPILHSIFAQQSLIRVIPLAHLIPKDSRVEIDAKIAAGYFTSGKQLTEADLIKTVGRTWEETEH